MVRSSFILITILSPLFASAANDWNKPCFNGKCSYDLHRNGKVTATLEISGSPDAISDITPAAGWAILGCDPNADVQDIRLVCQDPDPKKCNHLYRKIGASGKLVRLPDNCGKSAFARVARNWVHQNQTIPTQIKSRLQRRGAELPTVQGLTLDTNFAAIDPAKVGQVAIFIQGSTVPGATGNTDGMNITPARKRHFRGRFHPRGIFDGIKDIGNSIEDAFGDFNKIDAEKTVNLPPVDVNKNFPIFSKSLSCPASAPGKPAISASINVNVDANLHAVVQVGVVAKGTIVPPKITDFGLFAGMDADFTGSLNLAASASGTIDSGLITFFEAGIPGLDFPGILSIGPTFKIQGQAIASLESDVNLKLGMAYHTQGTKLYFPASSTQTSGGNFAPGDSPLKLSVDPSISVKGTVEAHLIPRVEFGISALAGVAKATVFVDLDASAALSLTLNAHASIATTINPVSSTLALPASSSVPVKSSAILSSSSVVVSSSVIHSSSTVLPSTIYPSSVVTSSVHPSTVLSSNHPSSSTLISIVSSSSSADVPYITVSSTHPSSSSVVISSVPTSTSSSPIYQQSSSHPSSSAVVSGSISTLSPPRSSSVTGPYSSDYHVSSSSALYSSSSVYASVSHVTSASASASHASSTPASATSVYVSTSHGSSASASASDPASSAIYGQPSISFTHPSIPSTSYTSNVANPSSHSSASPSNTVLLPVTSIGSTDSHITSSSSTQQGSSTAIPIYHPSAIHISSSASISTSVSNIVSSSTAIPIYHPSAIVHSSSSASIPTSHSSANPSVPTTTADHGTTTDGWVVSPPGTSASVPTTLPGDTGSCAGPVTVTVTVTVGQQGSPSVVPPSVPYHSSSPISQIHGVTSIYGGPSSSVLLASSSPTPAYASSAVSSPSPVVDISPQNSDGAQSDSPAFTIETAAPGYTSSPSGSSVSAAPSSTATKCKTRPATTPTPLNHGPVVLKNISSTTKQPYRKRHILAAGDVEIQKRDISASVDGCVEVTAGLNVNAGADASFFGLFSPSTKVPLFSKKFEIFKKCFGTPSKRAIAMPPPQARVVSQLEKRDLSCLASSLSDLLGLVDESVPAGSIAAI